MTAAIPDLKPLVIPDSSELIDGGASPALMHLLNDLNTRINLIAGYQEPPEPPPSTVLQIQAIQDPTGRATASVIPADNTVPQISEGDEMQSFSFTPKSATSTIVFEWSGFLTCQTGGLVVAALFISGTNDALCTVVCLPISSTLTSGHRTIRAVVGSWGTTAKTVSTRYGTSNASFVAGSGSLVPTGGIMGGGVASVLTITEYENQ